MHSFHTLEVQGTDSQASVHTGTAGRVTLGRGRLFSLCDVKARSTASHPGTDVTLLVEQLARYLRHSFLRLLSHHMGLRPL